MGGFLLNPVSITNTWNGFGWQFQSYGQSNSRNSFRCGCIGCFLYCGHAIRNYKRCLELHNVSIPAKGCFLFVHSEMKMTPINLLLGSTKLENSVNIRPMVASIESDLASEDENANNLTQREKEENDLCSYGQNLPPWRNLVVDQSLVFEPRGVDETSTSTNGKGTVPESRVYFLEERDEEVLSRRILILSRSNKVRSALELFRSMKLSDLRPNMHSCNSLLSCLLRNGLLDDAFKTFEFMKKNEITTAHTYSLVLKAIANAQGCHAALDMFAKLEGGSGQKDFDVVVYNTVISISGRMHNWVATERLWRSMKENGHIGTQITYSLLVSIFVRCDQNELAIDAYNEMVQNGLKPRDDAMHAMISACTKEGKWDLALNIFQEMLNGGLKPSQVACNALINSLGKVGKVKLAFRIYDIMKSLGHTPDAFTWNALLGALYIANQHADALELFERVSEHNSLLNVHLYNTALMSCKKLHSWDRALQLLWQMEASGLSVSTVSYNLVIGACEIARKPKVALQIYEHMVHQKCAPDTFTYLSLIRSCIWGSLWDEVEEILDQVAPNVSLYNAAIHGMCLRGKVESAKKLYMKMQKSGLKPDGKTRALMLQNLGKV